MARNRDSHHKVFLLGLWLSLFGCRVEAITQEPVQACVMVSQAPLTSLTRSQIAQCLGWQESHVFSLCHGQYQPDEMRALDNEDEVQIDADRVSFYPAGRSDLLGNVQIRQSTRIVDAQTAYVYRDERSNQVTRIELMGDVLYREPGKWMRARKATINPQDKSGRIEEVLYRFKIDHAHAVLPAWGQANFVERFANEDYLLQQATYSTCSPRDKAWQIQAREITLNHLKGTGVAKDAVLKVADWPVLYSPYLSFPTSKKRKSGFLMPIYGYSNIGGFDFAAPYYWNIAPNYDATITPHAYSRRGVMLGSEFRFLTERSAGVVGANFLPRDQAFKQFIQTHEDAYPSLKGLSTDRWSFLLREDTDFTSRLHMNINYQQVSDNYYLQDFSSNMAMMTENQLLRQGDLTYTTDHWLLKGMLQSYQTIRPIDQSSIADAYERLPQLMAQGFYDELPFNATVMMLGQFDYFRWPNQEVYTPQGARYHANPIISFPYRQSWGYINPEVQLVQNYYDLYSGNSGSKNSLNRTIPRYSVDSGLSFERLGQFKGHAYTQTLEPRLYYLYIPYKNQSFVPAFDSAYMIFNTDQLFRTNRFSGFDRISDANQLAYALTMRWISEETGQEKASVRVGQLRYFSNRRVQLCYQIDGNCVDSSSFLGYVSPVAKTSPIASKASIQLAPTWALTGNYVWDTFTHATNNGDLNLHYRPSDNRMIRFGYSYLVSGNLLEVQNNPVRNNPLHQATTAVAWPLSERWSTLGAYSYNISEGYNMMTFAGLQYDTCCWAFRLLGGHSFKSLSPNSFTPTYNNNVYFQVLLKGLGTVTMSDPATTIQTYLPGYPNIFQGS